MKYVSNRDVVIRSALSGQAIRFEAGVPQSVPRTMVPEVIEKGIIPVQDDGKPVVAGETQVVPEAVKILLAPEGEDRVEQLLSVFKSMVERNNPQDFTGGGHPSASAVSLAARFKVDQKEVRTLWEKHRNELLGSRTL